MSEVAIRVEGVSKQYRIGVRREKYKTLRDSLVETAAAPFRRMNDMFRGNGKKSDDRSGSETDSFWALKDVSFDIKCGEVVGVIGRNGAGKSTLLKVLSRITEPTEGFAEIHGRVGALLEVGTGFHQELTGRENVFLNGAILGMRREEIARKFDEIVEFAEVGKFIDTPVKRYSSGMHLRLAFSVAAHLEPEILLVDEVLAVGDGEFQKKCLGKMQDVARRGRTVLFVSHNMGMVTSLCQRAMLLEAGTLDCDGAASETVLSYYSRGSLARHSVDFSRNGHKVGDDLATLLEAWIEDLSGNRTCEVDIRTPFRIKMRYAIHEPVPKPPYPNFHFFDSRGEYAFVCAGNRFLSPGTEPGTYLAECTIPGNLMNNGTYFIGLALTFTHSGIHVSFYEKQALSVSVRDPIEETLETVRNGYSGPIPGPVRPQLEWLIHKVL